MTYNIVTLPNSPTLTDEQIQDLLDIPKTIITKTPAKGYKEENNNKRWGPSHWFATTARTGNPAGIRTAITPKRTFTASPHKRWRLEVWNHRKAIEKLLTDTAHLNRLSEFSLTILA